MAKDAAECERELMSSPGKKRKAKRKQKQKVIQGENNTLENDAEVFVGEDTHTKHAVDSVTELPPVLNSEVSQSQQKKRRKNWKSQDICVEDGISQDNAATLVSDRCIYTSTMTSSDNAEKGEAKSLGEIKSRNKRRKSKEMPQNSDKGLKCSAGETIMNGCAREEATCVEPSNLVGCLESSRPMNNPSSDSHASTRLRAQKSVAVKNRKKKIVNQVGSSEPLGAEEISLQFPAQCFSLDPEAPVFRTSEVACERKTEKKEHGRKLKEAVKNDMQDVVATVDSVEMKSVWENMELGSTSTETSLCQKGKRNKRRRYNNVGSDSGVSELMREGISLQLPAKCSSMEPEASISHNSKFLCKGSEEKEHGKMLKKKIKSDMQDGYIIQSLVGPEVEHMKIVPILEAACLESASGETSLSQNGKKKGKKKRKKRDDKIVGSDISVPEHPGEDRISLQRPAQYLSSENEASISCISKSVPVVKTEDKEYGKMIKKAVEGDLQVELKPSSEAAGLGSTSGELIPSQRRKRRKKKGKIGQSDSTVPEPPRECITSQHPSECLSLEHVAAISCGGVCISEEKNVKYKSLMIDQIVAENVVHLDGEFQSEGLPKTGNSERKSGSKVVGLESRRHIESNLSNPEDRGGFSNVEGITCSKEKTSLCAHSLVHKNPIGVQMDSKKKENTSSSKVENEDPHLLVARKDTPSHLSLENPIYSPPKKKLLILDINGLLADIVSCPDKGYKHDIMISGKAVFKRPFCKEFLQFCLDRFNVGVWSSRLMKNVRAALSYLMGKLKFKLLFCWDQRQCTRTRFKTIENSDKPLVLKELKKLWDKLERGLPWEKGEYDETNTLLVDDSPYKAIRNPKNTSIFPYPYKYTDISDTSLGPSGDIRRYLEGLSLANNVQEYVALNPFGQPAISESNPSWSLYRQIVEGHA